MVKDATKSKFDRARQFLATLLDETLEWSCTDTQHELRDEFKKILGEYCPNWLSQDEECDAQ